jgi:hypothetical protein
MKKLLGMFMAAVVFASNSVYATEIDMLVNKLAEKNVITYGEAQQIITETNEEVRKNLAAGQVSTIPAWVQNLSISGDLRLRHQVDWAADAAGVYYARTRERVRLRTGFLTRVVENVKAGFGVATGSEKISDKTISGTSVRGDSIIDSEPTSTNSTMGWGFEKFRLMVDYAFLEYSPINMLTATLGKMKSGTQVWNATDLLWDTDINPDGVAVTVKNDIVSNVSGFMTASWLTINELNSATINNPDAYIFQPGATWKANDKIKVKAAIAYQQFNVKGKNMGYYGVTTAPFNLINYNCYNPSFQIDYSDLILGSALSIFGDYSTNSNADVTSNMNASCYGVQFGSLKIEKFKDWNVRYLMRRIEANAWPNKLGDSDAYGGDNNTQGFEAVVNFGLTRSLTLTLDYYSMDRIIGSTARTPKSLVQCDMVYKF